FLYKYTKIDPIEGTFFSVHSIGSILNGEWFFNLVKNVLVFSCNFHESFTYERAAMSDTLLIDTQKRSFSLLKKLKKTDCPTMLKKECYTVLLFAQ
ncbi:MAG: hypothetical protein ABS911_13330, partial [Carnobacterium sp.]|uniref:hypothetical protein n=1 Tax=Carnobacterium sp. TaxID=48221 RepID=UPI003315BE82